MRVGCRAALLTLGLVGAGVGAATAPALAQCVNEQLRARQYALVLPDCRAYEQVSPVNKNATDAAGEVGIVQASPSGGGVTFFSLSPFPGVAGASGEVTYLSTFAAETWSTQGLKPAMLPGSRAPLLGLSGELSVALVLTEPGLEPGASPGEYLYLRDSATGAFQQLGFLEHERAAFADATPDGSRVLFETKAHLLAQATPGAVNLYEWHNGRLSLAGVLPAAEGGEAPAGGSRAGAGAREEFYTEHTISEDGSRVFFTDSGTEKLYVRVNGETTARLSAGGARFWAATPDGRYVFYTEGKAKALYRVDAGGSPPTTTPLTAGAAEVQGTLGVSADGSYAYFVATGELASNTNGNGEKASSGAYNLYEWHEGSPIAFIAKLSKEDRADWREAAEVGVEKSARVTPDGRTVLFSSRNRLTAYNNGLTCEGEGHACRELYVYDASGAKLRCVSCNPSGVPATSSALLSRGETEESPVERLFKTHNLSEDGSRVFFQTNEALVSRDTNAQTDVYEWERSGAGTCQRSSESFSESSGGCLYLISSGQSSAPSYFGDADAEGNNVFFFTRQSLVSQDQDDNVDLYDARVNGGLIAQNPLPPPAPCGGEACRGALGSAPALETPSSEMFSGAGNTTGPVTGPVVKQAPKPLSRAQKLARALKECRRRPRKLRGACQARARRVYGRTSATSKAMKAARPGQGEGGRER